MVSWEHILLPAALAAVLVFIASSLVHMVLQWHNSDYRKLPDEDERTDSASELGLKVGAQVTALIKAPRVQLVARSSGVSSPSGCVATKVKS